MCAALTPTSAATSCLGHQNPTNPEWFLASELSELMADKNADQLVFTTQGGHLLRLPNWRREVFLPARIEAGIGTQFRVHDLRHTAASLTIQAGYPPKMLQEIMGHASITMTLDLYGHLYPGDMDRYADRLDSAANHADKTKVRPDEVDQGETVRGQLRDLWKQRRARRDSNLQPSDP